MLSPYQSSKQAKPRVIAGIPAYNVAESIGDIIRRALSLVDEVIVADDGSTDNTAQVASAAGATVIRSPRNQGAGGATGVCFQQAMARNADVLVTLDGDGQHDAAEIPSLTAPVLRGKADLVIGSRFLDKECLIPGYRRFGISVITTLLNLASRVKVSDSQSCYRAYSKRALGSLDVTEPGFAFSVELIIKARRKGLTIDEVPISCIYHDHSHSRNPVVHGVGVALSVIRLRANRSRHNGASRKRGVLS